MKALPGDRRSRPRADRKDANKILTPNHTSRKAITPVRRLAASGPPAPASVAISPHPQRTAALERKPHAAIAPETGRGAHHRQQRRNGDEVAWRRRPPSPP
jgi:hypothetical protein